MRHWLLVAMIGGCGEPAADPPSLPRADAPIAIEDEWRAVLASPGGELPFTLSFEQKTKTLVAIVQNGPERLGFDTAKLDGNHLVMRMDGYDSEIEAVVAADLQSMTGRWTKTVPKGKSELKFTAVRGDTRRFAAPVTAPQHEVPESIAGDWAAVFTEEDGGTFAARGVFNDGGANQLGTFLTDTGDYRYLAGRYTDGTLQLSCFDGGHAFLFEARVDQAGNLQGDFWSRDAYHATWSAKRLGPGEKDGLANPFEITALKHDKQTFAFAFTDLDGKMVTHDDPRFNGKVVLIDIFGTWCPNCNDYARVLAGWDRKYKTRGLEIVGLAFEMTGDAERDRSYVRKYKDRFGIEFPLLLAGPSDKSEAAQTLSDLTQVAAYPTTIFVGRDGTVRAIHSGFSGPATGEHHTRLVGDLEQRIVRLLSEEPKEG